jgi:hypothetical protein
MVAIEAGSDPVCTHNATDERWQTAVNNGWSAWTNRGRPAGTGNIWYQKAYAS